MAREQVASNQRTRLYGAMIESVSDRGYRATTVAHLISLAGVSRRAFYELFTNKEDCFVGTYDVIIARARKRVLKAWAAERGWTNRVHASCKAFLEDVVEGPKGAHLVLIDSLCIGARARERLHMSGSFFEQLTAAAFQLAPENGGVLPAIAARAGIGGTRHLAFLRMREDRLKELRTLAEEVVDWVEAYRSPASMRLPRCAPRHPPEVALEPVTFLSGEDRRTRLLGAVVHLTLDVGYSNLTDAQIAQFAGLSTEALHKHFSSKQDCFLAVVDEFTAETMAVVELAIADASTWPESVYIGMATYVRHLVAHLALLRMTFVDLFEVGSGMIDRMTASVDRVVRLLIADAPEPRSAAEILPELLTGAVWDIIGTYATEERVRYLPCLVDHLAFVMLAPYIDPCAAINTIERCAPTHGITNEPPN
jgi:AcrR family transcriptional regulator